MRVPLVLISLCLALAALADDFKTADGKEYRNATVLCVEPDGIDIKTRSGISMGDVLQNMAWLAAGAGAIIATIKLWSELRQGREQSARDLRWKQAEAGKSLNDEMLTDPQA